MPKPQKHFPKKQPATEKAKVRRRSAPLTESFANKCLFCPTPKSFSRQSALSRHLQHTHSREYFLHSTTIAQRNTGSKTVSFVQEFDLDNITTPSSTHTSTDFLEDAIMDIGWFL